MNKNKDVFKFKYSTLVWVLLAIVGALCISGLVWNIYALIETVKLGAIKIISHSIMILLTLFLCVLAISIAVCGRYEVSNNCLIQRFGIIKTKIALEEIIQITHFKKSDKLVVYFKDEKYTVIVISPADYDQFIMAVRNSNPSVVYDTQIDGEDTPK